MSRCAADIVASGRLTLTDDGHFGHGLKADVTDLGAAIIESAALRQFVETGYEAIDDL